MANKEEDTINGYKKPCVGCNEECIFTCTIEPKCLKDAIEIFGIPKYIKNSK